MNRDSTPAVIRQRDNLEARISAALDECDRWERQALGSASAFDGGAAFAARRIHMILTGQPGGGGVAGCSGGV